MSPPNPELAGLSREPFLRLVLSEVFPEKGRAVLVTVDRVGRDGAVAGSWESEGGTLSAAQLTDLLGWVENRVHAALMWRFAEREDLF